MFNIGHDSGKTEDAEARQGRGRGDNNRGGTMSASEVARQDGCDCGGGVRATAARRVVAVSSDRWVRKSEEPT